MNIEESRRQADEMKELLKIQLLALRTKSLLVDFFISSPIAAVIFEFNGKLLHGNPVWKDILGYKDSEIRGVDMLSLVHPDDREQTKNAMGYAAREVAPDYFINRYRAKDGVYKWLLWHPQGPANDTRFGAAFCSEIKDLPLGFTSGFVPQDKVKAIEFSIPE